jgi:hypothetical protein
LRFGNMPLGGLPSREGDPPTFICSRVPIKVKKKEATLCMLKFSYIHGFS